MKNRHVIAQIYIHLVAFALIAFCAIGLIGFLFIDPASRLKVEHISDISLAGLLIAAGLLSVAHNRPTLSAVFGTLLMVLSLYSVGHNLAAPSLVPEVSWISGLLRMRSPLAAVLSLVGLALFLAHRGAPGRWFSQGCGGLLLLLMVLTHSTAWLPELNIEQIGFRQESNYIVHLFLVFIGAALILLPRLPDNREVLLDRLTVLTGMLGALITVLTWYLLSQQHLANQDPADSFAVTYLPNLILGLGLIFSFLIMTSQRLARLAIKHAQHLHTANQALQASLREHASLQALNLRIVEFSEDILCSLDEHSRFTQLSASTASVLGYRPEEMIGHSLFDYLLPEDRTLTQSTLHAMIEGGERHNFRGSCRRQDGNIVHLHWSGRWSASERTLFAMAHDVTPLVDSESFAKAQRDILTMISTDQPLADILDSICLLAESQAAQTMCSVLLVDKEQKHLLLGSASSLPAAFAQRLDGMPIGPQNSACGTAVFRRKLVISDDIDSDPRWQDLRSAALDNDLHACWSIPLISHRGDILGAFAMYHRLPIAPTAEHLQLINTASQLAAIAIEHLHDRLRLQQSEQRYRSLFTFNPDPVFSFDLEGRFSSMNQAGCMLSGYSEEELIGENLSLLVHNEDPSKLADYISTTITGGSLRDEGLLRSRDGQLIDVGLTHLPIIIDEKVVGGFGIAKDFSERNRMVRALREALQHSEHQAELLGGLSETAVNINSIINSHNHTDTLLDYMAERLRLLLGAHQSVIHLSPAADGGAAIYSVSLSEKYADWPYEQIAADDQEFSAKIRDTNQPILLTRDELDNHSRWHKKGALASNAPAKRGWLAVPLKDHDGTNLGLLQLSDKYEGDFDQDDLAIAQQFAQMAVAVLKNSQLVQAVLAGERRLKTQLEFTSAITNSVSEGLLAVDRQGLLTFINPTAADLLNQSAQQLVGQALAQYLPLALSDSDHSERTSSYHGEVSRRQLPQGERYLAFDSAPLLNEEGPQGWVVALRDISEQKRFESELAHNASHDVLTGLPNRALLEDRLIQGCKISSRYKRILAVMFIDLDGFKPINDSLGHSVGDLILIEVARRMEQQVRPGDTVARLGGDEFIVILPDLAKDEDVLLVANRLIENIGRVYKIEGTELQITASMGITLSDGSIEQPMHLIQQADLAMFKAKRQGKNNYQWYTEDLNQKVSERVYLRNELQKAIEAQTLQLYYQPQVDARSGRIIGYEALMRWQHAERGFIPPIQFIPVAEDTGQIIPMSEWALNTACQHARMLFEQGWKNQVMAVNISPLQFQRANFIEFVKTTLEHTGLPAELLELEITESVLMDNAEKAIQTLQALKDIGVRIAIDDFGTGFSSLNYLKRLPIDKVKIDRSFVQEIISDRSDAAITQGIISMAHHLGLKVIAEGVENEPQFDFLKRNQCDAFQGYYFAKPMPLKDLEKYLQLQQQKLQLQRPIKGVDAGEQTLLLLDDEENILRALSRVLRRDGYQILVARSAQDAFALLAKHDVHVILSDQRMPEMNGTEFLRRVKDLYPNTVRIVLSGYTDLKSVTDAINQGAIYKFLTKPWDDKELRSTIAQAFQHHDLVRQKDEGVLGVEVKGEA
jgi:diguanylate cyclase (GGDEF)-like protein/PAS domain S-box-containing protein